MSASDKRVNVTCNQNWSIEILLYLPKNICQFMTHLQNKSGDDVILSLENTLFYTDFIKSHIKWKLFIPKETHQWNKIAYQLHIQMDKNSCSYSAAEVRQSFSVYPSCQQGQQQKEAVYARITEWKYFSITSCLFTDFTFIHQDCWQCTK